MSGEESKALVPEVVDNLKITDISEQSMKKVQRYIDDGLPGIATIDETKLAKITELYLGGKTYDQIANATREDRTKIMFVSHRYNLCDIRKEYMLELSDHMKRRILEFKLTSQDHLLNLAQMYQRKHGGKIMRYLETNDEAHTDQINLKELDRYMKIVDLIQKSVAEPAKDKGPLIGLNVGDGATVTRKGDNEIEITPKQKAIGDVLKHFADLRREEEKN
jgi:hypothetical protein